MSDESNLLTVRQAAEHLCLPIGWLKDEALAGRVPCLRVGRRTLFNIEAVREALLKRAAETQLPSPSDAIGTPQRGVGGLDP